MLRIGPIGALLFLFLLSGAASAQTSITVSVSPGSVNWSNLVPGNATNAGSTSLTLSTSWNLNPGGGGDNLKIYAYFTNSSAALRHSPACTASCIDIPSSAFEIKVNTGAFTPATGTGPFGAAGASLQLVAIPITGANKNSSRVDTLQLNINLSALSNLPADTYSGVLNIQAQSIP